jgi:predicted  nucleic acid-binding Zn-ribbon protein
MNRLQGEKSNDELLELENRITELKKVKEEKMSQYETLVSQNNRVQEEIRKSKRDIEILNKEKTQIDSKIAELTLHIKNAENLLEKIISEKEVR